MIMFTGDGARLHVAVHSRADQIIVTLSGELDRARSPPPAEMLDTTMDGRVKHLYFAMAGVGFVDVAGVRTLLRTHALGADRGVTVRLQDLQPHIVWLLRTTGVADQLLVGHTTAERPLAPQAPADVPAEERDRRADER